MKPPEGVVRILPLVVDELLRVARHWIASLRRTGQAREGLARGLFIIRLVLGEGLHELDAAVSVAVGFILIAVERRIELARRDGPRA